jgi:large subunit ribosomal protein L19
MITNITEKKDSISTNLLKIVEEKYIASFDTLEKQKFKVGDFIKIGYKILEGDKERLQFYEGLVIAIQNRSLGKTFIIRRNVQGIGIEQIFLFHSPKIDSVTIIDSSKVRRAKLYYVRSLVGNLIKIN